MPADRPRVVFRFEIRGDRITGIDLVASPDRIREMDLVFAEP